MILNNRSRELKDLLNDALLVLKLVDLSNAGQPALQTGLYAASWQQYAEQIQNALMHASHAEMIVANGCYANLWKQQFGDDDLRSLIKPSPAFNNV